MRDRTINQSPNPIPWTEYGLCAPCKLARGPDDMLNPFRTAAFRRKAKVGPMRTPQRRDEEEVVH